MRRRGRWISQRIDGSWRGQWEEEIVAAVESRGTEEDDNSEGDMESSQKEERISHSEGVKSMKWHYVICNNKDCLQWMFYPSLLREQVPPTPDRNAPVANLIAELWVESSIPKAVGFADEYRHTW